MGTALANFCFLLYTPGLAEPEAFTIWLIGAGLLLLGLIRRRRRRSP